MKILIDIAHPAHIHYFRNLASLLEKRGHIVLFTLRDKGIIVSLAQEYKLKYKIRSRERKSKFLYLMEGILKVLIISIKFKPDLFIDMGTIVSIPSKVLLNRNYFSFEDTEAATKVRKLISPFWDVVFTPYAFSIDLGAKHIKLHSYMELFYLNKKYFEIDDEFENKLKEDKRKIVLFRLVSWEAYHDKGQTGISIDTFIDLIKYFESNNFKIIISSENTSKQNYKKYLFNFPKNKIHTVINNADIVISEGATLASECAMLGIPAIYVNTLNAGTLKEQENFGMLYGFRNSKGVLEKVIELLTIPNLKQEFQKRRQKMLSDKIDVNAFMVWFIENYPESARIMKENPDYQYKFK